MGHVDFASDIKSDFSSAVSGLRDLYDEAWKVTGEVLTCLLREERQKIQPLVNNMFLTLRSRIKALEAGRSAALRVLGESDGGFQDIFVEGINSLRMAENSLVGSAGYYGLTVPKDDNSPAFMPPGGP